MTNGLWSWSNITSGMLDKLHGTNAQARKLVHKLIFGTHQELSALDLSILFVPYIRDHKFSLTKKFPEMNTIESGWQSQKIKVEAWE